MLRPSALWQYYWARLRTQPLQELLALVGIATGVALIFAVLVANTSVTGSVEGLTSAVVGNASTQVTARDTRGVDEQVVGRIRRVHGVRTAAAMMEQRVDLRGPGGVRLVNLFGVTPDLATLEGPLAQGLGKGGSRLGNSLVLSAPLAAAIGVDPGGTASVEVGGRATRVRISAKLASEQVGEYVKSPLVLAPLRYAQRVTGLTGRVTRILVAAAPGREAQVRVALARSLGERLNVGDVYTEARLLRQAALPLERSAGLFAAISALVGLLFAFNAMLLTVPERRRFIAELRMQGFGAGQVGLLVLFEALILGAAASAAGLALGDQLSRHLLEPLPGYLTFAFPVGEGRIVSAGTIVIATAAGMVASLLAGARPLGDVLSRAPVDTLYRTRGEPAEAPQARRRTVLFIAAIALVTVTAVAVNAAPSLTVAGAGTLVVALLLALPLLMRALVRLGWALSNRPRGGLLMVAMSELEATPTRSVALAATAAVAVFGIVAIEGARRDLIRGLDRGAYGLTHTADLWVTSRAQANTLTTMPFSAPGLSRRLARTPGVAEVRSYQSSFLDYGGRRVWVIGRPRGDRFQIPPGQVLHGSPARAADLIRGGGWAAVSDVVARDHGMRLGQAFRLPTPSGLRSFRLAARLTNVGWASGTVILNANDYRRAWNASEPAALEIELEDGVSDQAGKRLVTQAIGPSAALAVDTAGERWSLLRDSSRQGLARLDQISKLALISAVLTLAAAISLALWQRRPRLAELRLQGFSVGQLNIALLIEMAFLLGLGALLGALFGSPYQALGTRWLELTTGFPTVYRPAGALAMSTLASVSLVALLIAALPGWVAASAPLRLSFRGD